MSLSGSVIVLLHVCVGARPPFHLHCKSFADFPPQPFAAPTFPSSYSPSSSPFFSFFLLPPAFNESNHLRCTPLEAANINIYRGLVLNKASSNHQTNGERETQ